MNVNLAQVGEFAFDSKSDDRDTASLVGAAATPVFERLSGAMLNAVVTPLGKVEKLTGYKQLFADLLQDDSLGLRSQFTGGGSDEAALLEMQRRFPVFSGKAVKPGDTWEVPYDVELANIGRFKGRDRFRFAGPDMVGDRPTARIEATAQLSIEFAIKADTADVSGKMDVTTSSATIQFDVQRGRVLSIEDQVTMEGNLTVMAGGMMIPIHQSQSQSISVKLLDKLPE